ncbi:hypothetical protein LSH36_763g02008 [Paralvinella palmiformis]|uniref:Uncharacterized protein n=1 Tax=Paralvinella palmiformis TaxID=53620 RepID=A0AAD9J1I4_9ANNE|nr:hypothetical protein LSH36_763g02008 [Paralvinella palmiformis]
MLTRKTALCGERKNRPKALRPQQEWRFKRPERLLGLRFQHFLYAKIAKSMIKRKTRNIETQTIITWPEGENPKSRQSKSIEVQTE